MATAPIIADFLKARCGDCKVVLADELATCCTMCGAVFDRVTSNHVGITNKVLARRKEAGVEFPVSTASDTVTAAPANGESHDGPHTAPIIIDFYTMRCGECKVLLTDELARECPTCGAHFDRLVSNHVGLAAKYEKIRG